MKIEKLPSGSYRIRKMYKGKSYSITTDYKPTQKEAIQLMAQELDKQPTSKFHMTFKEAAVRYVDIKKNVLSPRTVKDYMEYPDKLSPDFTGLLITDISQMDIQKEINRLSSGRAPKTVRNYHGFISAVLGTFRPELKICTTLPQRVKNDPYIPSSEDIRSILKHSEGTEYEVPLKLACYGMRKSEICALTIEDIEGDVIHINKALVLNEKNEWVLKSTKTTASTRDIVVSQELIKKIQDQGYIYKGFPNNIAKFLTKAQKQLGIKHFSLHKLRHYFASQMSAIGIPEADIMAMGGWETDHVMKSVYRHKMLDKEEDNKRKASKALSDALF